MRLLSILEAATQGDHPFDRRMMLELQTYFEDADWDTEVVEEPWLSDRDKHPKSARPDIDGYDVYPTVLEARKGTRIVRSYFIKRYLLNSRTHADNHVRIRITTSSIDGVKVGKNGYRDAAIVSRESAAEAWKAFKIAFGIK